MPRLEKVKEWILKSGYPLELEVIDTLKTHNWDVMPSVNYFDEDERKWRELDCKAYKHKDFGSVACAPLMNYQLTFTLIIQCKKSEKFTWVFFPAEEDRELGIEFIDFIKVARVQTLATRDPLSIRNHRILGVSRGILLEEPLFEPENVKKIKWLTDIISIKSNDFYSFKETKTSLTGVTAPLDGKKAPNELFEAAVTATKALVYEREITSDVYYACLSLFKLSKFYRIDVKPFFGINVMFPLLIFDGSMYLWQGRNSNPKEIDHIIYLFDYRSRYYFGRYTINVVRKNFLPKFLEKLNKDLENLSLKLEKIKEELDNQVELLKQNLT